MRSVCLKTKHLNMKFFQKASFSKNKKMFSLTPSHKTPHLSHNKKPIK